jgi:hypothetical protein
LDTREVAAERILSIIGMGLSPSVKNFLDKTMDRTRASIVADRPRDALQDSILSLNHMKKYEGIFDRVLVSDTSLLAGDLNSVADSVLADINDNLEMYCTVIRSLCKVNIHFPRVWTDVMLPKYEKAFEANHLKKLISIVNDCLLDIRLVGTK